MKGENTIRMTTATPKGEEVRDYEFTDTGLIMVSRSLQQIFQKETGSFDKFETHGPLKTAFKESGNLKQTRLFKEILF